MLPPGEPSAEASAGVLARVKLPLETGREMEFWSQLVLELPVRDLVRDATAKVCNAAIIGPNNLEILFPSAYHVCKALCEQPPTLERLGKLDAICIDSCC